MPSDQKHSGPSSGLRGRNGHVPNRFPDDLPDGLQEGVPELRRAKIPVI